MLNHLLIPETSDDRPIRLPSGRIIATHVTEEEYLERYAAHFCEWVEGVVIEMSPVTKLHDRLTRLLAILFETYFAYRSIGVLHQAPFVMRLGKRNREPDLIIVLNEHLERIKDAYVDGAADICIEVISEESIERDRGDKFKEYEAGGVREYWLIDPLRQETLFYRLDASGIYRLQSLNEQHAYHTPLLPDLAIQPAMFWQDPLPNAVQIGEWMTTMLDKKA